MRLPGHPERRHLRLLPEGEQPQAAGQGHGDAEEDEEDGKPSMRLFVYKYQIKTKETLPCHCFSVPIKIFFQPLHRTMSGNEMRVNIIGRFKSKTGFPKISYLQNLRARLSMLRTELVDGGSE